MLSRDNSPPSASAWDRAWLRATLGCYFRSGWAFFIPYFTAYLVYARLKWPVNPAAGDTPGGSPFWGPSLLHVYWALHAAHCFLGAIALRAWWAARRRTPALGGAGGPRLEVVWSLLPWVCLAAIFWIPGLYLEWPADPWEHLRRINEWHVLDQVTAHSAWKKTSYFLPYSLTQHSTGLAQLSWLNAYYTTVCLLLGWQYHRLARTVGLSGRAAMAFVLLGALTLGNNVFSFYRYYGLSSSILAQIGAVALTRLALEALRRGATTPPTQPGAGLRPLLRSLAAGCALLPWIAFNHVQGIGLAALGVIAVVIWRLVEADCRAVLWLFGAAVAASVAAGLWFSCNQQITQTLQSQGWLTGWYAFDLFSPGSPARERCLHILGGLGVANLLVGFWLALRRNHPAGWLTVVPVLALVTPCFALPFAQALASGPAGIVSFHRMLLAIPAGLAATAALDSIAAAEASSWRGRFGAGLGRHALAAGVGVIALLGRCDRFSPGRFWQSLQVTPDDLQLRCFVALATAGTAVTRDSGTTRIETQLSADVRETFNPDRRYFVSRQFPVFVADGQLAQQLDWLANVRLSRRPGRARDPESPPTFDLVAPDAGAIAAFPRVVAWPTAASVPWLVLGGSAPETTFVDGEWSPVNPRGQASEVFSSDLIPISPARRYQLSSSIRQDESSGAVSYVAVAWYDSSGELLRSNLPFPEGAGEPLGWSNGTYSYYGLREARSPGLVANYSITFGLGAAAEIPRQAKYLRVGALLNYRAAADSQAALAHLRLAEIQRPAQFAVGVPDFPQQTTARSFSALLSGHWSSSYVPAAQAGARELHDAVNLALKP